RGFESLTQYGRPAAVFDVASARLLAKVTDPTFSGRCATPAGDKLIGTADQPGPPSFATSRELLQVLDLTTGKVERTLEVGPAYLLADGPSVSPDGQWLVLPGGVLWGQGGGVTLHGLGNSRTASVALPAEKPVDFSSDNRASGPLCAFSPDARWLAVAT